MDKFHNLIEKSRRKLCEGIEIPYRKIEGEGGCGVVGLLSSCKIEGKYLLKSLEQMRNRGNGKGGGIAAFGLDSECMGVSEEELEKYYILQVAYLDENSIIPVERFINKNFDIHKSYTLQGLNNYKDLNLEIKPPLVYRYFIKPREEILLKFIEENGLKGFNINKIEDEFIYQKSFLLNKTFYKSGEEQRAFVLSSGKNMIVLKIVGYGDDVINYYNLKDFRAHLWIGHHRYPTKGKVWHPGGAHPFSILNHALVHNGDFSNYTAIVNYLRERNMYPLFLTDTEVAILLFDLWYRQYEYPVEYLLEAMAPTTERDFYLLSEEKQEIYKEIQISHVAASPDGPWFFIIGGNNVYKKQFELFGITDTSMLRPQVFSILKDKIDIGIIASERQGINAILRELKRDGKITSSFADLYWNARGGSHTDGGAYIFSLNYETGEMKFEDKFGKRVELEEREFFERVYKGNPRVEVIIPDKKENIRIEKIISYMKECIERGEARGFFNYLSREIKYLSYMEFFSLLKELEEISLIDDIYKRFSIEVLTYLNDMDYDPGEKKRSSLIDLVEESLNRIFLKASPLYNLVDYSLRNKIKEPRDREGILVINSIDFPPDGDESLARFLVKAYRIGWRKFIVFNLRGHRFIGCGFGENSRGVRIDCYGDIGDYAGSGIDGLELFIHSSGQDQFLNIIKSGKVVIYGDVGQTFMYGAKGGGVFVKGNAAGRPLINAVGNPKVVINGTCLDYLAESFMAGDPLNGGGFCILNGISFKDGEIIDLEEVYPGSNLLSLASGGAIYIRDPDRNVEENQLHGGKIEKIEEKDWQIIKPLLEENEMLFNIPVDRLLRKRGVKKVPEEIYIKIMPKKVKEVFKNEGTN